jgi:hypothetical protein
MTQADIINLIWANGRIIDATSATAPSAWRRYLHLMLDAYRAERAHPPPGAADDGRAALRRHGSSQQGKVELRGLLQGRARHCCATVGEHRRAGMLACVELGDAVLAATRYD